MAFHPHECCCAEQHSQPAPWLLSEYMSLGMCIAKCVCWIAYSRPQPSLSKSDLSSSLLNLPDYYLLARSTYFLLSVSNGLPKLYIWTESIECTYVCQKLKITSEDVQFTICHLELCLCYSWMWKPIRYRGSLKVSNYPHRGYCWNTLLPRLCLEQTYFTQRFIYI